MFVKLRYILQKHSVVTFKPWDDKNQVHQALVLLCRGRWEDGCVLCRVTYGRRMRFYLHVVSGRLKSKIAKHITVAICALVIYKTLYHKGYQHWKVCSTGSWCEMVSLPLASAFMVATWSHIYSEWSSTIELTVEHDYRSNNLRIL